MNVLRFLNAYEIWIYILLGIIGLVYLRKFILALREWQGSIFGLEKENAQRRLSESVSILIMMIMVSASVFLLTTFVYPTIPGQDYLPTPTLTMLLTPTVTLRAPPASAETPAVFLPTATIAPLVVPDSSGCVEKHLMLSEPVQGSEVSGTVQLSGTIAVENFGFYKYEYSQNGADWVTIAAGSEIKPDGVLGFWDTSQLPAGNYFLRLVVTDNQGQEQPACVIQLKVIAPPAS